MSALYPSESEETVIQRTFATPALTNSTGNTPASVSERASDPFLASPTRSVHDADISASFIIPATSYEVTQYSNLHDVAPEWDDEEVEEIMVLSPKKVRPSVVPMLQTDSDEDLTEQSIAQYRCLNILSVDSGVSRVSLARRSDSSAFFAVKAFAKSQLVYDAPKLEQAMTEQMMLRLLTRMDVAFVLKLRESFQDDDALYLVTEFCPGGDMRTLVTSSGPLDPVHARFYAAELIDALHSLHTSGITHRTVRPSNLYIASDGHLVLSGFAHAAVSKLDSPKAGLPSSLSRRSQAQLRTQASNTSHICEWSAPEIVLGWGHDTTVDSWGFGATLFFMLTGQHPVFPEIAAPIHKAVIEEMILHAPLRLSGHDEAINAEAYNVLCRALTRNSRLRLSVDEIMEHAYFTNTNWDRLRTKDYDAPLAVPVPQIQDNSLDDEGLKPSESLSGVHIPGFDFTFSEDGPKILQDSTRSGDSSASITHETPGQPRKDLVLIQEQVDEDSASGDTENGAPMDRGTTEDAQKLNPNDQSFVSSTDRSAISAPSTSTALYSCTSFGELRETLDQHVATPPGSSNPNSAAVNASPTVLASSRSGSRLDPSNLRHRQLRAASVSPPVSIMRKEVVEDTPRALVGRGLGLRKFASLDFDLDTIVSLDADLSNLSASADTSGLSTPSPLAKRRVSFVDTPNSEPGHQQASSPKSPDENAQLSPSGWMSLNFGKYASPNLHGNKLKKKRVASTPVLQNTPQLLQKVHLPAGLEQIGLGIGYTRPRPLLQDRDKDKEKEKAAETPRRSVSLGASVARCGALLTNLARGKRTSYGADATVVEEPDSARASEESEGLDAVMMREVYGSGWDGELGVAPPGGITAGSTRRRAPGRVYTVHAEQLHIDSTVRLVDPPQVEF